MNMIGIASGICLLAVGVQRLSVPTRPKGSGLASPLQPRVLFALAWVALSAVLAVGLGAGVASPLIALTCLRVGAWVKRRLWRGGGARRATLLAVALARALDAELRLGGNQGDAILRASTSCSDPVAQRVLNNASRRIRLGCSPAEALGQAIVARSGEAAITNGALMRLVAVFGAVNGATGARSLRLFAQTVEASRQHRAEISSKLTEARFVVFALPAITALAGLLLVTSGAANPVLLGRSIGLVVGVVCFLTIAAGVAISWQMTRVDAGYDA